MKEGEIDDRIREAKRLVRESEAVTDQLTSSVAVNEEALTKLRTNLEALRKLKAEIVTHPRG